jgi:hypothetical protein
LHSFSSSLCHKDIKSFNFLVNHQLNVKIADLELGGCDNKFTDQVGMTISWQSPEVIKGDYDYYYYYCQLNNFTKKLII